MKRSLFLKITSFLLLVLLSFSIIGCNKNENTNEKPTIIADAKYEIHTDLQKEYLAGNYVLITRFASGKEELSKPNPVTITWDVENASDISKFSFVLSEFEDFSNARKIDVNTNQISLYNLKIFTKYYWYVKYLDNESVTKTEIKTFYIDNMTPRNLNIDGITNARDVGGYKINDNKYSNQGLIYRSGRFNENETTTNLITEDGIKEMVEVLKIKSELDLRRVSDNENGGITVSPLGEAVNYYSIPMQTKGDYLKLNVDVLKDVFAVLGDESNYPVVIHCSIGTDRTGLICFLINALLGVSEEDLYKDYLFSNFGNIGGSRSFTTIQKYIDTMNNSEGSTLAKKTYNYLVGIGVSEEDLNNLISIMTK